jgi:hypothetical protein
VSDGRRGLSVAAVGLALVVPLLTRRLLGDDADWIQVLIFTYHDETTLGPVRRLVRRYPLRGFHAIHLGAALWLRKQIATPSVSWQAPGRGPWT